MDLKISLLQYFNEQGFKVLKTSLNQYSISFIGYVVDKKFVEISNGRSKFTVRFYLPFLDKDCKKLLDEIGTRKDLYNGVIHVDVYNVGDSINRVKAIATAVINSGLQY